MKFRFVAFLLSVSLFTVAGLSGCGGGNEGPEIPENPEPLPTNLEPEDINPPDEAKLDPAS
jgi:hypothetical protein